MMKIKMFIYALKMLSNKRQHSLFIRALNFLVDKEVVKGNEKKTISLKLRESKTQWSCLFNGCQFVVSHEPAAVSINVSLEDLLYFPSGKQLKDKIATGEIEITGSPADRRAVVELLLAVNPVKVNQCVRYLRGLVGLKAQRVEDKPLNQLSIRDIGSDTDVNYVRDQAIIVEPHDPALAYKLMFLAHGARPKGPFIKRKLAEYRSKGFHRIGQTSCLSSRVIPIVEGKLGYFPVPKSACSSIKTALYEYHQKSEFDSVRYAGTHIHDYWLGNMSDADGFERNIIVVRDPIERFLSAYSSRVLDHGELNYPAIEKQNTLLLKSIPHFKPTLKQFVNHLDAYMQVPSIAHHCMPLSELINYDITQFSDVIPLSEIKKVEELVSELSGKTFTVPHHHAGKNKTHLSELTREQLELLLDFYASDYELLAPWFSKTAITEKWERSMVSRKLNA